MGDVTVAAVDPGLSTGLVVVHNGHKALAFQGSSDRALYALREVLTMHAADAPDATLALIAERYVVTPRTAKLSAQGDAQRVLGALDYLAKEFGYELVLQSQASAWAIASNQFLRAAGLYVTPGEVSQHDSDDVNMAMRHAVLRLATKHATLFEQVVRRVEAATG